MNQEHFYQQDTLTLARSLIGCLLVSEREEGRCSGIIVETEAYIGPGDRAAHSYNNRRTARTEIMFGPPGMAYVYLMHQHALLNVVSGVAGAPEAVLIRAIEPVDGVKLMQQRRGNHLKQTALTNGPGKLCKALGITRADNGHDLRSFPLRIELEPFAGAIAEGVRIGIPNTGEARDYPWRFWAKGNAYVSRGR